MGVSGAATLPAPAGAQGGLQMLVAGARVGHYELIRELGRGGMGQVFLARDTKLGRRVAVKFMMSTDAGFAGRFMDEARATAQATHENIVVIHEFGEHQGTPYMVLEYVEGETLTALMKDRKLPAARAVQLIVPVLRALVRLHELDIVHRDLKPDNVLVTTSGMIKVLDFGISKLFSKKTEKAELDGSASGRTVADGSGADVPARGKTNAGAFVGTFPYMAPEQFTNEGIDARTDLWAIGIMLFEMVAGRHPLEPWSPIKLFTNANLLDEPMPSVSADVPDLPGALEVAIDRCLAKPMDQRYSSASELLAELEPLLPGTYGRALSEGESPYPGLAAFQETDANRFFGRSREIVRVMNALRDNAMVTIVGPSGVGKSSLVRAGLVPALKATGTSWESFITRPGRDPLAGLASLLQPLTTVTSGDLTTKMAEHEESLRRLRTEPGYFGSVLRSRARQKNCSILLYVDQLEELYTIVEDDEARTTFTNCLMSVADDPTTPLRVVVSMRSDFLDRAADEADFARSLTRSLILLPPPSREGLRSALTQPVEMVGHRFESEAMINDMVGALEQTPGALPLLQFTAAKLWDARDRDKKLLTSASYKDIGGVGGALASHASEVLAGLPTASQRLLRTIFQRLVTPERTRAIVGLEDLRDLGSDPSEVDGLLDVLVNARLLVVQTTSDGDGGTVELVHESLITSWPTLQHWLDESHEDSALLEQLRVAAKQWDRRDRPVGLLWRGEAVEEARRFMGRDHSELTSAERAYLEATLALDNKSARRRQLFMMIGMGVLGAIAVCAVVAFIWIRNAEKLATSERDKAQEQKQLVHQQLTELQEKEKARLLAVKRANSADKKVQLTSKELEVANTKLKAAMKILEEKRKAAEEKAEKARIAEEAAREAKLKAEADTKKALEERRKLLLKMKGLLED